MPVSKTPRYIPANIEPKWQRKWEADGLYHSDIDPDRKKYYALTMLPYPSGNLHIGHWYAMTPSDARARFKRMQGYNVLFPMGFDSFGLPAENAAIQRNIHPKKWTYDNIDRMREQMRSMGNMFDWRREAISSDPKYYRWTQWFFIQLLKNGLAYRQKSLVDWCPKCNTTLAREQVIGDDRHCERCHTPVVKKELEQWFFRITRYADELLDFTGIDWPEPVKLLQTNWIGRSEGASVVFHTEQGDPIEVFTTRPDTLWGATFMVLAPEHPLLEKITSSEQKARVEAYVAETIRQTDIQREATDKEKTGVFTGGYAINPVNNERIPIWVADYVLMTYGTGAIMAVPAHDQRDFEFARKFRLEVRVVIQPDDMPALDGATMPESVSGRGKMVNSGVLNGTPADQAFRQAIQYVEQQGFGKGTVNYRLRDWLISRQRYWGAPIPVLYCEKCGVVPVADEDLPVLLPDDVKWKPTGESPLKLHPTWRFAVCPQCGGSAERETDTMDTFVCSSWYHLRYLSPDEEKAPFDQKEYDYWMPVDSYTGGVEHATMHLMYTRFFHKAFRDLKVVKGNEPMLQLRNQGQILGPDGQRMSKSRGNVVDPDTQVKLYGADTVRAFLMFGYRWAEGGPWEAGNITGVQRWLNRVWNIFLDEAETGRFDEKDVTILRRKLHQTLRAVTRDYERFEFNTIVSGLMELSNYLQEARAAGAAANVVWKEVTSIYLRMLAPICPHISEEIWNQLGLPYSVHAQPWPELDEKATEEEEITIVLQVNGKLRDKMVVPVDISEEKAKELALANETVQRFLEGAAPRKIIYVPGKLVNIVK
ncbi:MAG TPA: leucine--tRNA ligase [Anaerolineaceae bacterium]|nr:leucine--tRNA ligase [Anaerolineaceae bacterium]